MKHMKHLALMSAMLLCSLSVNARETEINGIWYNLWNTSTGQYATVTSAEDGTKYAGTVTIPSTVAYEDVDYSVTEIERETFKGCNELTSVTIPASVTDWTRCFFWM